MKLKSNWNFGLKAPPFSCSQSSCWTFPVAFTSSINGLVLERVGYTWQSLTCFKFFPSVWLATQNHSALVRDTTTVPFLPVNPSFSSTRNQVKWLIFWKRKMLLNNYPTNPLAQICESWLFTVCTVVSSQTCLYLDLGFSQKAFWCKSFSNKFPIS